MSSKTKTRRLPSAAEIRARNFESVGLQPEASRLAANEDIFVEAEQRQTNGQRGNANRARRMSGLDWLWQKGRLEHHQMQAGLRYGDDYRASTDVRLRSCIADVRGGDGLLGQEKRVEAQRRLYSARYSALSGHAVMIALSDLVAGEGERITTLAEGDDTEAKKKEAVLLIALDLLADHYGMISG